MICAIHQPNFLPWLPFFKKIQQADVFVFLGHCDFTKGGYQNRFYFNKYYTLGVNRESGPLLVDKLYSDSKKDWLKIKNRLIKYTILDEFDQYISNNLARTNVKIIHDICSRLDIKTGLMLDYRTSLTSTARLVDICKRVGATTYLSGVMGKQYLDREQFKKAGIKIEFQKECEPYHILEVI